MSDFEKVLYTAKAHTTGGREGGSSRTDDGRLDIQFTIPGTPGTGTNPEQLLAAGWSACFLSAIKILAAKRRVALPGGVIIDIEVDLGATQGQYGLAARFNVTIPGVDLAIAREFVDGAHHICPYSLATRGNVDVAFNVLAPQLAEVAHA